MRLDQIESRPVLKVSILETCVFSNFPSGVFLDCSVVRGSGVLGGEAGSGEGRGPTAPACPPGLPVPPDRGREFRGRRGEGGRAVPHQRCGVRGVSGPPQRGVLPGPRVQPEGGCASAGHPRSRLALGRPRALRGAPWGGAGGGLGPGGLVGPAPSSRGAWEEHRAACDLRVTCCRGHGDEPGLSARAVYTEQGEDLGAKWTEPPGTVISKDQPPPAPHAHTQSDPGPWSRGGGSSPRESVGL